MGDGSRCLVGCVGTAAAQILNYWQWPPHGRFSHSYWWPGDVFCGDTSIPGEFLIADFRDAYDWPNIPDSCDNGCSFRDSAALGELNYEVAAALETMFSVCGSATFNLDGYKIYTDYFFCSPDIEVLYCYDHSLDDWFSIIQTEIDSGRPVHYFSFDHSMVCDGYRSDGNQYEIHLNYGWGGPFTAWYILDEMTCSWQTDSGSRDGDDYMYINIEPYPVSDLNFYGALVIDTLGDSNGHAIPGETIEISPALINHGWDAMGVRGILTDDYQYLQILNSNINFIDSLFADTIVTPENNFLIRINSNCPDPWRVELMPEFFDLQTNQITDSFILFIGNTTSLTDNLDTGQGFWRHKINTEGCVDDWQLDDYRSHSGDFSFNAGGPGSSVYSDNADGILISPPFLLPPEAKLSFWHYLKTALFGRQVGDGAQVYITDGFNPPQLIYPTNGYTHMLDSLPCFAGDIEWTQVEFDLSAYSGVVQIIFRFVSDQRFADEGWYIDDFQISSSVVCGDPNRDSKTNMADVVFIVNYVFVAGSPAPSPICSGDANGDGNVNVTDAVYIANYSFAGGMPPQSGCCD
jgi:hypothetical protein